jgi:hypothetical protein
VFSTGGVASEAPAPLSIREGLPVASFLRNLFGSNRPNLRRTHSLQPGSALDRLEDRLAPAALTAIDPVSGLVKDAVNSDLKRLAQEYQNYLTNPVGAFRPSDTTLQVDHFGRVFVRITADNPETLTPTLAAYGFERTTIDSSRFVMNGWLPITSLADMPTLASAGLNGVLSSPKPFTKKGSVTSQADWGMNTEQVRNLLPAGVDGSGVRVGVLSDSYDQLGTAALDVATGDLPAVVDVLQEGDFGDSDEGRAMFQLVHDLAPQSSLVFATANGGQTNFAANVRRLADPNDGNAQVVMDDIGYLSDPFFQDGEVAVAIDEIVTQRGAVYFSAAGNIADQSYEQVNTKFFVGAPTIGFGTLPVGTYLDFDASSTVDFTQSITVTSSGSLNLVFQWDDPFFTSGGVGTDIDIFLYNSAGTLVGLSTNLNQVTDTPLESIFTFLSAGTYQLVATIAAQNPGAAVTRVKWVNFGSDTITASEYNTQSSTITGQPGARNAIAVGAVPFFDQTRPEDLSSKGPVTILFSPTGVRLSQPEIRNKPEVAGIDNTDTTFFGAPVENDGNDLPNFPGTSAATPHVAAVAALIKQQNPTFTPAEIYQRLIDTARDLGSPLFTGAGLVDAVQAVYGPYTPANLGFATDTPTAENLGLGFTTRNTGAGRVAITSAGVPAAGDVHYLFDSMQQGTASLNEFVLHVNTQGTSGLQLSFKAKGFRESIQNMPATFTGSSNTDGVALSVDGTNWFRVTPFTTDINNGYTQFVINLRPILEANNLTPGADLRIKFQQFGSARLLANTDPFGVNARPTGGVVIDDIKIDGGRAVLGSVYNDVNENGLRDTSETGFAAQRVYLDLNNNSALDTNEPTTTTDVAGNFEIIAAQVGTYALRYLPDPANFIQTGPASGFYTITGGPLSTVTGQDFGAFQRFSISGVVYSDANGNGVREPGEVGQAGVTVQVLDATNLVVASAVSTADGSYTVPGVGRGTYRVREIAPVGSFQTSPAPADIVGVSGTNVAGIDFGNFILATVRGTAFEDLNGNAIFDAGEPPQAGIQVFLVDAATNAGKASATTAADGTYSFTNLPQGTYRIFAAFPAGFTQSTPTPGVIDANVGGVNPTIDFGLFRPFNLGGIKFNDANANGVRDSGEAGVAGVTIQLFNAQGTLLNETTTTANGSYLFTGLTAGTYRVREVTPTGTAQSTPNPADVVGRSGATILGNDFGNAAAFVITGTVFIDRAGDGFFDPGAPGVAPDAGQGGVRIELVNTAGVVITTTVSDANGVFTFPGVGLGTFRVRQVVPNGFAQTTLDPAPITAIPGGSISNIDFGNRPTGPAKVTEKLYAVGADAGGGPRVTVYNANGSVRNSFFAYEDAFRGGVRVALADINADGTPDIITTPAAGGGPRVRVFDGNTFNTLLDFFAFDPAFRGGLFVAGGDLNGDGFDDMIVAPDEGGGPIVRVFKGFSGEEIANFFAYDTAFRGGVRVGAADINGDGRDDIITAPSVGGGPIVRAFSGVDQLQLSNFFAGDLSNRAGLFVAGGDLDGDGLAEIVVGNSSGQPLVGVYSGAGALRANFLVTDPFVPGSTASSQARTNGVRVAVGDSNGDGQNDIITGMGSGTRSTLRGYSFSPLAEVTKFDAFEPTFRDGIYVGGNN